MSEDPNAEERTTPVEGLEEPTLPDSYRAHVPPTAIPAPTQHKTIETATVKIKEEDEQAIGPAEEDDELRRRVTVRTRQRQDTPKSPRSSNAPIVLPEDREALEDRLMLRRATASSKHWYVIGGSAAVLAIVALVWLSRSGPATSTPSAPAAAPTTPAVEDTKALVPAPPPAPEPAAAEPEAPEPSAPATATAEPAAAPKGKPKLGSAKSTAPEAPAPAATQPPAEPKTTAPPKASFPPASGSVDIRRDVPF